MKQIYYDQEARQKILAGAETLYNAVKTTFGPLGQNVIIERPYGAPIVTHDGVTVAENIELEKGTGENIGARLIKDAASKLNKVAGDGTTTVTVLTYHILSEANKLIAAGESPMQLRQEIEAAGDEALKNLPKFTEKIDEKSQKLEEIATISSADSTIGKLVADTIKKIGSQGIVTVEAGQGIELKSEIVEGYTYDKGYASPFFMTDQAREEAISSKPAILITDQKITSTNEILPILEQLASTGKKDLVIIAEEVTGEALSVLVLNKLKGVFNTLVLKAPSFGDQRKAILSDIATLTGANVISEDLGQKLDQTTLEDLGSATKVIATKDQSTIIEGTGKPAAIKSIISQLTEKVNITDNTYEKEQLEKRLAALENKVARIIIGGTSEIEIDEKKYRVEDSVAATKAALEDGIVAGGGVTLINLAEKIKAANPGAKIVKQAFRYPFKHIVQNAGLNQEALLAEVEKSPVGHGINIKKPEQGIIDLKKSGVIDPAKVTREAISQSISIAATAITMGALVVDIPEPEPKNPEF